MLKKRITAVVLVKDGIAIQSFGYGKYMPIGNPLHLVENFDRWGADEILLHVIDRSASNLGPDLDLIKNIARLKLGTPLIYGGGISSVDDGIKAIHLGVDRLSIDTVLHNNLSVVSELGHMLGKQALIGSFPLCIKKEKLYIYNYIDGTFYKIDKEYIGNIVDMDILSEFLLIDVKNEGFKNSFNKKLINHFLDFNLPSICFGGISSAKQISDILAMDNVSSVAIGNFLNYSEHAIQKYMHISDRVRTEKYHSTKNRSL